MKEILFFVEKKQFVKPAEEFCIDKSTHYEYKKNYFGITELLKVLKIYYISFQYKRESITYLKVV
jgi:hypothetical protein